MAVVEEWQPEDPPPFLMAGSLAQATAECELTDLELRNLFDLVEDWLRNGDEEAQTALATGFLEGLIARSDRGGFDFRRVAATIGPETREYYQAWDSFCRVKTPGIW